jgi:hypothetical protein
MNSDNSIPQVEAGVRVNNRINVRFVRAKHDNNFVVMSTAGLRDAQLSWKAKGLLAYLLSLPDDWAIYLSEIESHSTDKTISIRTGIKELTSAGYLTKHKTRAIRGRFAGWEYIVHEIPQKDTGTSVPPNGDNQLSVNPPNGENHRSVKQAQIEANPPNGDFPTSENRQLLSINNNQILKPNINNAQKQVLSFSSSRIFLYYLDRYRKVTGKEHPPLKDNQYLKVRTAFEQFATDHGLTDTSNFYPLIDQHFSRKIKSDWNVNHFASGKIMEMAWLKLIHGHDPDSDNEPDLVEQINRR